MNIFLIGYRCTGKTAVGKALAKRLDMDFVDADDYLVEKAGKSIKDIFAEDGEPAFRDLEEQCLKELGERNNLVVAAGGGAVMREANVETMKSAGKVVLLEADAETIHKRMKRDPKTASQRPNLTDKDEYEEIVHMLEKRRPHYRAAANIVFDSRLLNTRELVKKIAAQL
jgi:shikimate kinase